MANGFNNDIGNWVVSNVEDMESMFENNKFFNQNIKHWDVDKCFNLNKYDKFAENAVLENKHNPFYKGKKYNPTTWHELRKLVEDNNIKLGDIDVSGMLTFNQDDKNKSLYDYGIFQSVNRSDFSGIEDWDVSNVTNFNSMFHRRTNLTSLDLSNWNVSSVADFSYMFYKCTNLTSVGDLSKWDVSKSTNFYGMFDGCVNLTSVGDLSNWNVSKGTNFYGMFRDCTMLTSIGACSNWDTSSANLWDDFNKNTKIPEYQIPIRFR